MKGEKSVWFGSAYVSSGETKMYEEESDADVDGGSIGMGVTRT